MNRVLLIGKRAAVLTKLQTALRDIGIEADVTQDVTGADVHQLRAYAGVAFGRAVQHDVRARMKAELQAINPSVVFVDGLAPITPLLVAQFEEALDRRRDEDRLLGHVMVERDAITFELRSPADVRVTMYRLTLLYRVRTRLVVDRRLEAGLHHVDLRHPLGWLRRAFAVVRAGNHDVRVIAIGR